MAGWVVQDLQILLSEPGERVLELAVSGEIDLGTVGPVREAAEAAATSGRFDCLLFNLEGLTFIDSTGLHMLCDAHRAMTARGGQVKLVCTPGHVRKVIEITGLDEVLPIFDQQVEALALAA